MKNEGTIMKSNFCLNYMEIYNDKRIYSNRYMERSKSMR